MPSVFPVYVRKFLSVVLALSLAISPVYAQSSQLSSVVPTSQFALNLQGVLLNSEKPFDFQFVVDGVDTFSTQDVQAQTLEMVKYFLTSVAIPDTDLWVNLSPAEPDRIIPQALGQTGMGKILLEQDAELKQLTSELMSPDTALGEKFWNAVQKTVYEVGAIHELPVQDIIESFNKVWIVPGESLIIQDETGAFIQSSRLKVMLEEDYKNYDQALAEEMLNSLQEKFSTPTVKSLIQDIIVPEIEREVNEGERFAPLRRVFHAHLLATWYKNYLQQSLLNQVYADQQKVSGIAIDASFKNQVYENYLKKFRDGAFDVIREDYDPSSQEMIARKYFSGGVLMRRSDFFGIENGNVMRAMMDVSGGKIVVPLSLRVDDGASDVMNAMLAELDRTKTYMAVAPNGAKVIVADRKTQDDWVARHWFNSILENNEKNADSVGIRPTGNTPKGAYKRFVEIVKEETKDWPEAKRKAFLSRLIIFNMDEYYPGPDYKNKDYEDDWRKHPDSYYRFMRDNLFDALFELGVGLKEENLHIFNGQAADPIAEADAYEKKLEAALEKARREGGVSIGMGGVGVEGHIAFNESAFIVNLERLEDEAFQKFIRDDNDFVLDIKNTENPDEAGYLLESLLQRRQDLRGLNEFVDYLEEKIKDRINLENESNKGKPGFRSIRHFSRDEIEMIAITARKQKVTIYVENLDGNESLKSALKTVASQFVGVEVLDKKETYGSLSRPVEVNISTLIANAPYFENPAEINGKALTIGVGTFRKMDQLLILAYGGTKSAAVFNATAKPASPESSLSLALAYHPHSILVADFDAIKDLPLDQMIFVEIDMKDKAKTPAQQLERLDHMAFVRDVYFKKSDKGNTPGMIWRRKGASAQVGNLNIKEFPANEKVLVLEFEDGDFETYLPGQNAVLRETYGDHFDKNVLKVKIGKTKDGRTSLQGMNRDTLLRFAPGVIFVPTTDFDPRLAEIVKLLASQRPEGIGVEYYSRIEDRFASGQTQRRFSLASMTNALQLQSLDIPVRPNIFTFADQIIAERSQEIISKFETQVARTPFGQMIVLNQRLSSLLAKYFGVEVESGYADMGVWLDYDFETQELVYDPRPHQFVYGKDRNDPNDPNDLTKIVMNRNSRIVKFSPHPDDEQVNASVVHQKEIEHGIPSSELVQDWSGNAAYAEPGQGTYAEGSLLRKRELIAGYVTLMEGLGYTVLVSENENPTTRDVEITIQAFKGQEQKAFLKIDHLAASYGQHKPKSGDILEDSLIQMVVDLLKLDITEQLQETGQNRLTTYPIRTAHMKDQHERHRHAFFRAAQAVLFRLSRDGDFKLKDKVERMGFYLYLSTWAGEGQTYAHFKPNFQDQDVLQKDISELEGADLVKAISLVRQKILAMASSELATDQPGGMTFPADMLGGEGASRSRREGILVEPLTLDEALNLWALYVRDHAGNNLDGEILHKLAELLISENAGQETSVLSVSPKVSEVSFWKQNGVVFYAADTDAGRSQKAVEGTDARVVQMNNPADFPVEKKSVNAFIDFNQVFSTLPDDPSPLAFGKPLAKTYISNAHEALRDGGYMVLSLKLASRLDPIKKGYTLIQSDDLGRTSYNYYAPEDIPGLFSGLDSDYEFVVPDQMIDVLNSLNDGNTYTKGITANGDEFIIRQEGLKDPIAIVFARKTGSLEDALMSMKDELPQTVDAAAMAAPGGIDLGYGRNIKIESKENSDLKISDDIMRQRQNLKSVVPVIAGPAVPLSEFLKNQTQL